MMQLEFDADHAQLSRSMFVSRLLGQVHVRTIHPFMLDLVCNWLDCCFRFRSKMSSVNQNGSAIPTKKLNILQKAQKKSGKFFMKTKNFYKNVKRKFHVKETTPDSSLINSQNARDISSANYNSRGRNRVMPPSSSPFSPPPPPPPPPNQPPDLTNAQEILNEELVSHTNHLLEEMARDISPNFFRNPQQTAKRPAEDEKRHWIGFGDISMSGYDTAWLSMVPEAQYKRIQMPSKFKLAFPECFTWLIDVQHVEGGSNGFGYQSVSSAMATLLALGKFRINTESFFEEKLTELGISREQYDHAFLRNEAFLRLALNQWDIHETSSASGAELIIPYHLTELEKFEPPITLEFPNQAELFQDNNVNILKDIFFLAEEHQRTTILHWLEAFIGAMNLSYFQTSDFRANNGSYGSSPAATAAVLIGSDDWDNEAFKFLKRLLAKRPTFATNFGLVPTICDLGIFEACAVLQSLGEIAMMNSRQKRGASKSRILRQMIASLQCFISYLRALLIEQKGVLRSASFDNKMPTSVDETAIAYYLITQFDPSYSIQLEPFINDFWNGEYFLNSPDEEAFTTSSNVHIVQFLLAERENAKKRLEFPLDVDVDTEEGSKRVRIDCFIIPALEFIRSQRSSQCIWTDHWHSSPWYTTMKSIQVLLSLQQNPKMLSKTSFKTKGDLLSFCRATIDYALSLQHADGSWGEQSSVNASGNMEETSYVIRLLQAASQSWPSDGVLISAIYKGRNYLSQNLNEAMTERSYFHLKEPYLWLNKVPYTLPRVIRASVLLSMWDDSNAPRASWEYIS
ncbi:hypothetical protein G9A89_019631 [Geosiphon pyriformis]|nr:hypothetical protein G9A89_019631 [Geosiphon pyriformis]